MLKIQENTLFIIDTYIYNTRPSKIRYNNFTRMLYIDMFPSYGSYILYSRFS